MKKKIELAVVTYENGIRLSIEASWNRHTHNEEVRQIEGRRSEVGLNSESNSQLGEWKNVELGNEWMELTPELYALTE